MLIIDPAFLLTWLWRCSCRFGSKMYQNEMGSAGLCRAIVLLVLCMFDLSAGTFNPFIYFRF